MKKDMTTREQTTEDGQDGSSSTTENVDVGSVVATLGSLLKEKGSMHIAYSATVAGIPLVWFSAPVAMNSSQFSQLVHEMSGTMQVLGAGSLPSSSSTGKALKCPSCQEELEKGHEAEHLFHCPRNPYRLMTSD